jgi:hypothetical protein
VCDSSEQKRAHTHTNTHATAYRDVARHVGRVEEELGPVLVEERGVATALLLGEHVKLTLELRVGLSVCECVCGC